MKRPQLHKREREQILLEIAELARQISRKASYLFISKQAEQIGCGCMDKIDLEYFTKQAYYMNEHAIGLIQHYDLHKK